jgi:hypothetical protein
MEFYSATIRMKFCHSQENGQNWRTSLSEVTQAQRPKASCNPSYADYRPKTNAAILWDTGHTKGRPHMGGIEQGKKLKT